MGERPWTHWCVQHGPQDEEQGYSVFDAEDEARAFAEGRTIERYGVNDIGPEPAKVRRCRLMPVPAQIVDRVIEHHVAEQLEEECGENPDAFAVDAFACWSDQFAFWDPSEEARAALTKAIQACVRTNVWEYEPDPAEASGKDGGDAT